MKKYIFIVMFLLFIPTAAFPHAYLMSSEPAEDAILTESPEKATLDFLGNVEHAFSKIEVLDKDSNKVSGKTEFTETDYGTAMHVKFIHKLEPGQYTVKWNCLGMDGHKQKGSYTFTIK
jgi:methionine-rich copper-binding protein CopC